MPTMDTQTSIMLAGGVLVLIAVATLIIYKKKQSHRLHERFGQEYDRSVDEAQVDLTDKASTENLRLVLRRYRSFFERLLSL